MKPKKRNQRSSGSRSMFHVSGCKQGIISLPVIFAFIILIIAVGIGMTAISLSESFISAGEREAGKALLYAEAGARDALVRVARNKNYICATADCYSIPFATNGCTNNDACVKISVSAGVGSSADQKIITSKGQSKSSVRTIEVRVQYDDALEGQIATSTTVWHEISD